MGHNTWNRYEAMMRMFKHYHFNVKDAATAAHSLSFSSYAGSFETVWLIFFIVLSLCTSYLCVYKRQLILTCRVRIFVNRLSPPPKKANMFPGLSVSCTSCQSRPASSTNCVFSIVRVNPPTTSFYSVRLFHRLALSHEVGLTSSKNPPEVSGERAFSVERPATARALHQ